MCGRGKNPGLQKKKTLTAPLFLPAMSGAEPWAGSNSAQLAPMLALGQRPKLPTTPPTKSETYRDENPRSRLSGQAAMANASKRRQANTLYQIAVEVRAAEDVELMGSLNHARQARISQVVINLQVFGCIHLLGNLAGTNEKGARKLS